jgi:predicted amidophosphoribosyltransferase
MLKIIHNIIDQIFPPRSSELLVRTINTNEMSRLFRPDVRKEYTTLSSYQHPAIKALIQENKFYGNYNASRKLSILLNLYTPTEKVVYLPIPLGKKRHKERGYNQVTRILEHARVPFDESIIVRTRETPPQTSLERSARLTNLDGAFSVNREKLARYQHVTFIIIDDVTTTGTTLAAARAALLPHLLPSCSLTCMALAH